MHFIIGKLFVLSTLLRTFLLIAKPAIVFLYPWPQNLNLDVIYNVVAYATRAENFGLHLRRNGNIVLSTRTSSVYAGNEKNLMQQMGGM
jgi:hypothetical protein